MADRILDAFGFSLIDDMHFDAVCDLLEEVGTRPDPGSLCDALGRSGLPDEIVSALLVALINSHLNGARDRLVRVAAAKKIATEVV